MITDFAMAEDPFSAMYLRRLRFVGLADRVGLPPGDPVHPQNGQAKAVRFSTLAAIYAVLECQPSDLLSFGQHDLD
ncbi:helix-turn-helix domain-containing protein [Microlunatus sp. GCM10028923]|uniref:helix-turn-helix domain-containing protein n=1 Tax=Microlunatus sp. GCM10028923 TaxID=3273400 RepID=UPI00361A22B7